MQFDVLDKDGKELQYGDNVEYWSYNDKGDKDWIPATITEIKAVQAEKLVVKLHLQRKYQGRYSYRHAVWVSNLNNVRKV